VESFEQVVLALEVAAQFGTEVDSCHWWELPQVSLLSQEKFCHDKSFVMTKIFCFNKCVCHDKNWWKLFFPHF